MKLSQLVNFTPEKLLIAIERATRARYRYVYQCNNLGVRIDAAIDHQLINHMTLLQDIAQAAGGVTGLPNPASQPARHA